MSRPESGENLKRRGHLRVIKPAGADQTPEQTVIDPYLHLSPPEKGLVKLTLQVELKRINDQIEALKRKKAEIRQQLGLPSLSNPNPPTNPTSGS